jgi:hypothetical protein
MFNEFLYKPSPYLFRVYSNPHNFMNILLSICEVLIGQNKLFFPLHIGHCNKYVYGDIFYPYVIISFLLLL